MMPILWASVLFALEYSMMFDMLLLLLFVFVYHCIIMKAYETTNQLGFSAVVVVGVVVVVVLLDQNFSAEAAAVIVQWKTKESTVYVPLPLAVGSMTMIGDDWPHIGPRLWFFSLQTNANIDYVARAQNSWTCK